MLSVVDFLMNAKKGWNKVNQDKVVIFRILRLEGSFAITPCPAWLGERIVVSLAIVITVI
jgi:hypothetical protein